MVTRDVLGETVFLEGYHAVFTGNRNGGAPHLQGRQEPKGTLLSSCRMRQTTAKLVTFFINAPLRRRRLPTNPSVRANIKDTAEDDLLLVVPWPAAKQMRLDGARGRGLPPVPLRPRQPGLAEGYGTLDQAYAG